MTKKRIIKLVYGLYILLFIAFIFSNSLATREASAETSGRLLTFVNGFLGKLGSNALFTEFVIRKLGHFTEFFLLGFSVAGFFAVDKNITKRNMFNSTYFCLIIAACDETVQYFSGRGSMLLDVWLDYFSSIVGIAVIYFIYRFLNSHKKNR